MMQVALFTLAICLTATPTLAQTNWFTPGEFRVTCRIHTECPVNETCRPTEKLITIDHNRSAGFTKFVLPDGSASQGVLGVMSFGETQVLAATTSTSAEKLHRINIFPDAAITIGIVNYIDRPEDSFLYGTCKQPES